jgi:hypothetical protein
MNVYEGKLESRVLWYRSPDDPDLFYRPKGFYTEDNQAAIGFARGLAPATRTMHKAER